MCDKKKFHTEKQALRFGRGHVKTLDKTKYRKSYRSQRNGRVRAYFCHICKAYHNTKQKIDRS